MVKHLKMFVVEQVEDVVVLSPQGDSGSFRYHDLHMEANSVRGFLLQSGRRHLVIDLRNMEYCGSEFIGALISMLRETRTRGGKGVFCCARPEMLLVLQNMSLFKLWPHYGSRTEALAAVQAVQSET